MIAPGGYYWTEFLGFAEMQPSGFGGFFPGWSDESVVSPIIGAWVIARPIPEPATMLLLGSGLIGLAGFRRKFRKS